MALSEKQLVNAQRMLLHGGRARSMSESLLDLPLDEVEDYHQRYREIFHPRNIVGTGVGERQVEGSFHDTLVLRVYVREKRPNDHIPKHLRIPATLEVPGIGEVETDVFESGQLRLVANKTKMRPAQPGCSIGHDLKKGTLGCFVKKAAEKDIYLLSNSHVIARDGLAPPGLEIFQPAEIDDDKATHLASLSEYVPFEFSDTENNNLVDAAIAKLVDPADGLNDVLEIGNPNGIAWAKRNMEVRKYGRTSELTEGKVIDVNGAPHLLYGTDEWGNVDWVGFQQQIVTTPMVTDGDSGSLLVNADNEAIGLVFATGDGITVCNQIQTVFEQLNVELA